MAHAAFDTLKYVETLTQSGIIEGQAKAMAKAQIQVFADVFDSTIATKSDLFLAKHELKDDISIVRTELKEEIASVKTELKKEIASVRAELKEEIVSVRAELKADINLLRTEMKEEISLVRVDMKELEHELSSEIAAVKSDVYMMKWMLGIVMTGIVTLILKAFLAFVLPFIPTW